MMKQYTKPSVEVLELSVRENMAALPTAIDGSASTEAANIAGQDVTLTTYNLSTAVVSE